MSWGKVSNAFERSRNKAAHFLLFAQVDRIMSWNSMTASSVENLFLKPY
jgi:hypothetical protein